MTKSQMFGIEVNFLVGCYVATFHNDRQQSEWPPHPARLFSALVAVWADADHPDPSERQALEWLEAQGHPSISASIAIPRTVVSHFVPVNDTAILGRAWQDRKADKVESLAKQYRQELAASGGEPTKKVIQIRTKISKERDVDAQVTQVGNTPPRSAKQMLPEYRSKQERFFPSVTPEETRVTYAWPSLPPDGIGDALDHLLSRLTRLGHSSSLVSCRAWTGSIIPTYVPDGSGLESLRSIRRGQLAALEHQFAVHRESRPRSLPYTDVRYQAARKISKDQKPGKSQAADHWLIFEIDHGARVLPATRTVQLAKTMRSAILHYAKDPVPEGISGHDPAGGSTANPHVALLSLPYVGFEHADGRLLGMAVSIPGALPEDSYRALLRAIGTWESKSHARTLRLTFGSQGVVQLFRQQGPAALVSLRPSVWQKPSQRWISATPIALPRHPGRLRGGTASARAKAWSLAEAAVVAACRHVGLPQPSDVQVSLTPFITGGRNAGDFPPFLQNGQNGKPIRRQLVHASLTFETAISGPMLLGTGRFLGLGLMRPVSAPTVAQSNSYEDDTDE